MDQAENNVEEDELFDPNLDFLKVRGNTTLYSFLRSASAKNSLFGIDQFIFHISNRFTLNLSLQVLATSRCMSCSQRKWRRKTHSV